LTDAEQLRFAELETEVAMLRARLAVADKKMRHRAPQPLERRRSSLTPLKQITAPTMTSSDERLR
jgi:hypothetical protein